MNASLPYTRAQLSADLQALGVREGQVVMMHSSVRAVGALVGGADEILQAVLGVLGSSGTLMMYAGWQDMPDDPEELSPELQALYQEHYPPFDPASSRAVREHGILVEFFRTLPQVRRSNHPEASMIALGAHADELTANHPLNYGYGTGSPLEKLVNMQGKVLMLGAPLDTITLLHYAEYRAQLRHKRVVRHTCPVLQAGRRVWIDIEDFDTGEAHDDYQFEEIAQAYVQQGGGQQGKVGSATSYLFDSPDLCRFAIEWLEHHFGLAR